MSLTPIAPRNEASVTLLLEQTNASLTEAIKRSDIVQIGNIKAQSATVHEATKQLGLSKDIQFDAQEMVRRSEFWLGKAIRHGQAEGTIAPHGGVNGYNKEEVAGHTTSLPKPLDFGSRSEIYGSSSKHGSSPGALALADDIETEQEFDAALEEARAEGNLSRANVARKAREKSGRSPAPAAAGSTERAHQEAELVNAFSSIVRHSLTPKNVATLTPKAKARLISILEQALSTLKESS